MPLRWLKPLGYVPNQNFLTANWSKVCLSANVKDNDAELASAWRQGLVVGLLKSCCCLLLNLESSTSAIRSDN